MDFLDLLFKLIAKFILLEDGELEKLRQEAHAWRLKQKENKESVVAQRFTALNENWFVKLCNCFLLLALWRWLSYQLTKPFKEDRKKELQELEEFFQNKQNNQFNQNKFQI